VYKYSLHSVQFIFIILTQLRNGSWLVLARKWSFLHKTEHRAAHAAEQLCIIVLVSCMMRPTPTPCAVGHNATRVESARTVYTQNRVWPYVWRFPCQKYRTYTVYTYECMVLANSTNVPNKARQITSICTNSSAVGLHTKQNNWPTFSQWITNGLCVSQCTRANGQHSRRSNWPAHKAHQLACKQGTAHIRHINWLAQVWPLRIVCTLPALLYWNCNRVWTNTHTHTQTHAHTHTHICLDVIEHHTYMGLLHTTNYRPWKQNVHLTASA
jgi:hypothetical protein